MNEELYTEMAELQEGHWWFQGRRSVVREVLGRHVAPEPGRRVLEIGCGTGGMLPVLLDYGTVEGLEMSPTALELCRKQFGTRVGLHQGALPEGIPERGAYGLVTAFDVLEHIPGSQLAPALDAIREALRPGGQFVCTVPAFQFLWSEHDEVHHHHRRYTRQLLTHQLTQAGLEVRWCSYFNTLLFPPIAAVRLLARALPRREQKSHLGSGPGAVNALLSALFSAERHLVPRVSLPFGVSLVAVCQRSADAAAPAQTLAA